MEGSQTLLTWSNNDTPSATQQPNETKPEQAEAEKEEAEVAPITEITAQTRLKDLIKQYPFLKGRLPELNPKFKMLNTPLGKLILGKVDVQMMSERSEIPLDKLIEGIKKLIS